MGIHDEKSLKKRTPFEAEMCRRLWWALALFDARIGEMANDNNTMMTSDWDCRIPLNVNDSELWEDMKEVPPQRDIQSNPSDALFVATRARMADITRRAKFYTFFNPAADSQPPRPVSEFSDLVEAVHRLQSHLASENRIFFMTARTAKIYLARCHLLERLRLIHTLPSSASWDQESTSDSLILQALNILAADTELCSSSLVRGFQWFNEMHFPFFAYMHIARALRQHPLSTNASEAWETMGANYKARFPDLSALDSAFTTRRKVMGQFFGVFAAVIARAWEAQEAALSRAGREIVKPTLMGAVQRMTDNIANVNEQSRAYIDTESSDAAANATSHISGHPVEYGGGLLYDSQSQISPWTLMPPPYDSVQGSTQFTANPNLLDWDAMNWG